MGEFGPNPEAQKTSIVGPDFRQILEPGAYIDMAKDGIKSLRKLFSAAEQ
jgi:hypothetical protein